MSRKEDGRDGRRDDGSNRRDEVGRSGVYPVSGPHPENPDAKIHDQKSWGQGDRGDRGYEDSGGSELDLAGANRRENEEIERKEDE